MSIEDLRARAAKLTPKTYLPHALHARQREFMALTELEVLFGGAAGGGKSDALLAGAIEFADRPRFSSLILRRTLTALKLRGSIMDRANDWLAPTDAQWSAIDKKWTFPSGATLQFGYCDDVRDLDRYKSAEFHYIGIDELTEWPEEWYGFLFSRIRRLKDDKMPLKMRAATNPDGVGAEWVRRRFNIPENEIVTGAIRSPGRVFLPARAEDNPSLDIEGYEKSLEAMTGSRESVAFQQLRWGRWIRSGEGLVYGSFDTRRDVTQACPKLDRYVLSISRGLNDVTGFSVLGWRNHERVVYVESAWNFVGAPSAAASIARGIAERTGDRLMCIIGDTSELGEGYNGDARERFDLPMQPATVEHRRGYIDLLNDALKAGMLLLVGPNTKDLVDEWITLPWNDARTVEQPGHAKRCANATLYGWHACAAFLENPANVRPARGSPEAQLLALDEAEARLAEDDDAKPRAKSWARRMAEGR